MQCPAINNDCRIHNKKIMALQTNTKLKELVDDKMTMHYS